MADENLPSVTDDASDDQQVTRDSLGRFVAGVSGNPVGRTRGSRSRAALIREAIEEALQRGLSDQADELMKKAMQMALEGDKAMLRLILGDMLKPARSADPGAGKGAPRKVVLKLTQNFGRPEATRPPIEPAIEAEFKPSED